MAKAETFGSATLEGHLGRQDLDRDFALEAAFLALVHDGHSAASQLLLDHVVLAEGLGHRREKCINRVTMMLRSMNKQRWDFDKAAVASGFRILKPANIERV